MHNLFQFSRLAFFLTLPLLAQHRGDHRFENESFAERRVNEMSRRFELTDSQRTQALAIFRDADREAEPLEDRLEQARRDLRDATRRSATNAEIDQMAATVGVLTGQLEAINAKADTAFHNTLSSKQREAFQRGPRGRKGPPPPPRR